MTAREGSSGPACVLVVDDSATVRGVVGAMLAEHGYRVLEAGNGAEATSLYRERGGEIDVVLLDEEMPVMGGREAMRLLRAIDPEVKVVCMSGDQDAAAGPAGEDLGFCGFIAKPFKLSHLLGQVAQALGRGGAPRLP